MKKSIIILTLLLTPAKAYLQWEMSSIQRDVSTYLQALEYQDMEKIISYMSPVVLEEIPKEEFLEIFSGIFSDSTFAISYSKGTFVDASEIIEHQKTKYRAVFFTTQLNVSMPEKESIPEIIEIMKYQYGDKNVRYNDAEARIEVFVIDWMYALKNPSDNTWTFLTGNSNYLIENLIPQIVIDTFAIDVVSWMARRI